jgi:GTPase SAR1 family protein
MKIVFAFWGSLINFESLALVTMYLYHRCVSTIGTLASTLITRKLVVVGDQSSGKSSLLEGLTGLSFPIATDLCTRFATQIVLRRAPAQEAGVKITIIPGPDAQGDEEALDVLLGFERTLSTEAFDSEKFQMIFEEVSPDD